MQQKSLCQIVNFMIPGQMQIKNRYFFLQILEFLTMASGNQDPQQQQQKKTTGTMVNSHWYIWGILYMLTAKIHCVYNLYHSSLLQRCIKESKVKVRDNEQGIGLCCEGMPLKVMPFVSQLTRDSKTKSSWVLFITDFLLVADD